MIDLYNKSMLTRFGVEPRHLTYAQRRELFAEFLASRPEDGPYGLPMVNTDPDPVATRHHALLNSNSDPNVARNSS